MVKTERGSVVKTEREIDEAPYELETVQCQATNTQIEMLKREKEQIIKDLVKTKGENQKQILQLQQKKRELELLKKDSAKKIHDLNESIQKITSERKVLQQRINSEILKNQNSTKTITDLQREVSLLSAQISGLQSVSQQHQTKLSAENSNKNKGDESGEFEVECILAHRVLKRHRKFLVRWKDYSSDHDIWVKENDLCCPEILTEYLRTTGLSPPKSE